MFQKILWSFFVVANLIGAYYFAHEGNIGMELINLVSLYICWKELKHNEDNS